MRSLLRTTPPLIALALLAVSWEAGVRVFDVPDYILPPPSDVWTAFGDVRPLLGEHIRSTITEAFGGLVLGAFAGVALAGLLWMSSLIRRTLFPLIVISQSVPIIVIAPLLVLWFGFGLFPKVLVVALATFFPVVVATVQGLAGADRNTLDLFKTMGASRWHTARFVLVPSAAPPFFAGLRIAASYAVVYAVVAEWIGSQSGLGILLTRAQASFRADRVLVAVVCIALLSLALVGLVNLIARLAMPWHSSMKGPS